MKIMLVSTQQIAKALSATLVEPEHVSTELILTCRDIPDVEPTLKRIRDANEPWRQKGKKPWRRKW